MGARSYVGRHRKGDPDLSPPAPCGLAPDGWWCTGDTNHDGPCSAWPYHPGLMPDLGMLGPHVPFLCGPAAPDCLCACAPCQADRCHAAGCPDEVAA